MEAEWKRVFVFHRWLMLGVTCISMLYMMISAFVFIEISDCETSIILTIPVVIHIVHVFHIFLYLNNYLTRFFMYSFFMVVIYFVVFLGIMVSPCNHQKLNTILFLLVPLGFNIIEWMIVSSAKTKLGHLERHMEHYDTFSAQF
jgi:hypothetical protein